MTTVTADKGVIANQASGDATVTWTGNASDVTFTVADEKGIYGTETTGAGQLDFDKVTIIYTLPAGGKEPANMAFTPESITIVLGDTFEAPVLTKDTDAPIAWDSTDKTVATVDANGNVTVLAIGSTTITATAAENDNYYGGSAFYILTVKDPKVIYDNACTTSDCGFEIWGVAGVANPWSIDPTYGLKATGYKSGENTATEGVMSSPVLDLTNRTNITLDFDQAVNMFKNGNTMLSGEAMTQINNYISVVIAEVENETIPADWTKLADATLPESQSWSFYAQNPTINLDAYKGKKVRIGFKYTSTTEMAGTWEIKNVLVKGDIVPELPAPTAEEGVTITESEGGWNVSPKKYPVTLTFAVEDGVQMYAKSISGDVAQAAAEDDNDGYTALVDNKLTLTKTGEVYSVYAMKDGVKSEAKTVTATVPSGIGGIEAEDGEAVYFNLQGVRVQNPEKGIFIRVQNGNATKIMN